MCPQILIFEILDVFLWLKISPTLHLKNFSGVRSGIKYRNEIIRKFYSDNQAMSRTTSRTTNRITRIIEHPGEQNEW